MSRRDRNRGRAASLSGLALMLGLLGAGQGGLAGAADAPPVRPHPENPRYFEFRGKPTFLITSGEHYGAVLNADFDYGPYLDTLRSHGFNQTRTFSGTYHEVVGSFKIRNNTLAPQPDRYLGPWRRSDTPGALDGGHRFDLGAWDDAYFRRLKDFVAQAGRRGVVVEYVLFCPFYDEALWAVNPMNARNNVNGVGNVPREEVYTLRHPDLLARQLAFVKKAVTELHGFDNVYFEVCNEPYFGGVTLDWQARVAAAVVEAEAELGGPRHMIAQNIANKSARVRDPNPAVSLFNFHYAAPPVVVAENAALARAIGDDETGFRGTGDTPYRTEAWDFLFAGGSLYSNLDYSYTVAHPDGSAKVEEPTPGGGGPTLRKQLAILREFLSGFDFLHSAPDPGLIKGGVPEKATARALATPGKAYAVYVNGGRHAALVLELPAGRYRAEWVNTRTGAVDRATDLAHPGGRATLESPDYDGDVALRVLAR